MANLNPEQQQAVEYNEGPLLIVAGAGTGKTSVLVEKIKQLISSGKAKPEEILALTFTEKAANEMEERVDKALPYGYFQMSIATFHSFADQLLRTELSHIGLNPDYKLLTQAETIMFLRANLFRLNLKYFRPLGNPNKFLEALLQHFSRLRDEDITPEDYLIWAEKTEQSAELSQEEKDKNLELAHAYTMFQNLKIKAGYFDFSDLIFYLLQIFRKRPNVLKKYQEEFKYMMVDEFQDTNIAQYALIKLLCPPSKNPFLTVVGDDSQAIYKFRGASISNIMTFMHDYPKAKQVTLNTNYRSYQNILDTSYQLIQHNNPDTLETKLGISKKLVASRGKTKDQIHFSLHSHSDQEAEFVAKEILELRNKRKYEFGDFAILTRANSHADILTNTFNRYGIPYVFQGPGKLFKLPEIKDLIAYLKVLYNMEDSVSLYRVLTMEIFNFNQQDIALLLAFSRKTSLPLFSAIEANMSFFEKDWFRPEYELYRKFLPLLQDDTKTKLIEFMKMVKRHIERIRKDSAGHLLYYFLEDTGYLKKLASIGSEKDERVAMNISKFFNKLKQFETENEESSVFAVVDYIEMSMELGESPMAEETDNNTYNAINILTVHGSKGLEFPVVFLVSLIQGRFPSTEKREPIPIPTELIKEELPQGNYHLQEERRLFYVAATRAKDLLYLSASKTYGEGKRERKISPFVVEMLGEQEIEKFKNIKAEEELQLSIFDFKKPEEPVMKDNFVLRNFSYSQLESFNSCSLQYKYQYLLKIPTQANAAASFGDSIHRALQNFYQSYIQDTSIGLPELLDHFSRVWIPLGYSSPSHEGKMKKEGERMLTEFFNTFHHEHMGVMALERLFKIKVDDEIFITGKIDRVDSDGEGNIEIIDYKTGRMPDEKELKKSLQLSIYALAAMDQGLYRKKLEQVTLTFYYFQDMKKISMKRTPEEIEKVKEHIRTTVEEIRKNEFKPKVGPWCNFCSFRMICEAWQ